MPKNVLVKGTGTSYLSHLFFILKLFSHSIFMATIGLPVFFARYTAPGLITPIGPRGPSAASAILYPSTSIFLSSRAALEAFLTGTVLYPKRRQSLS